MTNLSIIFPCYNEEKNLALLIKKRIRGVAKGGDSLLGKFMLSIRTFKFIINLKVKLYGNYNT